jgi:hypothetical protein
MTTRATSRRRQVLAAVVALVASGAVVVVVTSTGSRGAVIGGCGGALIPAYVGPAALDRIAERPSAMRLVVINPGNGPGAGPRADLRRAVAALRPGGTGVLGYVHTAYGARDFAAVMADARRYRAWYGVDGIFVDETAHDTARLPYYRRLAGAARAAGLRVVALNPGTVPARGYFDVADVVVTFEGPYADYDAALATMPAWLRDVPLGRIAHLVYGASREQALRAAGRDAAGHLYVTSASLPDPWSVLPPYLDELERRLASCV